MLSAQAIKSRKSTPLVVATAYDFPFAGILEKAGVDVILVGDSLANVVLGLDSTSRIGMGEMTLFLSAVVRGAPGTHITADMPFGSYENPEEALANAKIFKGLGASSVKLEGWKKNAVQAIHDAGIPVMGHIGVLPQTATSFRPVGSDPADRERLIREARGLEEAGVFSMVLENVHPDAAKEITAAVFVPTIGIGSGKEVNGQVQVLHDLLGLSVKPPPFAKRFASVGEEALRGIQTYVKAVRGGKFP